jgi:hypothetical protein
MYTQFLSLSEGAGNTAASAMTEAINAGVTSAVGRYCVYRDHQQYRAVHLPRRCSCPCRHEHFPQHEEFRSLNHAAQRGGQKARPFSF